MSIRSGFVALVALPLAGCATLPPPSPALARHLAAVDAALAALPADLAAAQREAEAATALAHGRVRAGGALATVAASVSACRDVVAALAARGVTDPLLVELSAARATCRIAAESDALLGKDLADARD